MTDRRPSRQQSAGIRASPSQSRRASRSGSSNGSTRSGRSQAISTSRRMSRIRSNYFVGIWQTAYNLPVIDLKKIGGAWHVTLQPYEKMGPITIPLGGDAQCDPNLENDLTARYGKWKVDTKRLTKLERHAKLECYWRESQEGALEIQYLRWPLAARSAESSGWLAKIFSTARGPSVDAEVALAGSATNTQKPGSRQK